MAKVTTVLFGELAILPIQAKSPAIETLEWLTEVMVSYNGTEQTTQLRENPRQTFSYTFPEDAEIKASAFAVQYGGFRSKWAVPVWPEAQYIGVIVPGNLILSCITDVYDFRASSLALLYQSSEVWQVIEIDSLISGQLTLLSETNAFTNAWLMPIRIANLSNSITRKSSGYDVISEIKFEVTDNVSLDGAVPTQYLGNDIYTTPTLKGGERIDSEIRTNIIENDYDLGIVSRHFPWLNNVVIRPNNVICENPSQVRDFKKWLMRRAGKLRSYWEPTFENDLTSVNVGTIGTALQVKDNGLLDWIQVRTHICIETTAGIWYARKVNSSFVVSPGIVQLTLDTTLGIDVSTIVRISYLGLKRFNTDRIEIQWPGAGIAISSISTIELQP